MTPLLALIALRGYEFMIVDPGPPVSATLSLVVDVVLKAPPGRGAQLPVWRQTQGSWNAVWEQEAFGVASPEPGATRFQFRVPPDAEAASVKGVGPFAVEAYENGLPLVGIRRQWGDGDSLARPLGFRYGSDGLCTNVSVFVLEGERWRKLRLSRSEATLAGKMLAGNEYYTLGEDKPSPRRFGIPWIRITAERYGDYWIDDGLNCVGPSGTGGRLNEYVKQGYAELIARKFK